MGHNLFQEWGITIKKAHVVTELTKPHYHANDHKVEIVYRLFCFVLIVLVGSVLIKDNQAWKQVEVNPVLIFQQYKSIEFY